MWDCVIIGGGPAGLTAATYLGRFKRAVLVVDGGESRVRRIPLTRNTPGFPDGIAGSALLGRMQDHASSYGAHFRGGIIDEVGTSDTGFRLQLGGQVLDGRTVLLATGAKLTEPPIANVDDGLKRGLIRYCPICDGYEVRGQRIAVLGGRRGAIAEAHFLRTFSNRVTYLRVAGGEIDEDERVAAQSAGISIADSSVASITLDEHVRVTDDEGAISEFDALYPCIGCDPQSELAQKVGARCSHEGGVIVDAHQRTNVAGLYAAGDILQGLDQIASACGQGAIAAVAIHNQLREQATPPPQKNA